MTATRTRVRRWGSRLAIVIPTEVVQAESLKEGGAVPLEIRKMRAPRDLFGRLARRPVSARAVKERIRREDAE